MKRKKHKQESERIGYLKVLSVLLFLWFIIPIGLGLFVEHLRDTGYSLPDREITDPLVSFLPFIVGLLCLFVWGTFKKKPVNTNVNKIGQHNPNYPKDNDLHTMYQSHIKKWKPLIESNDPSIYSTYELHQGGINSFCWRRSDPELWKDDSDCYRILKRIVDNPIPVYVKYRGDKGRFRDMTERETSMLSLKDKETRYEIIRMLFDSYVYTVEHIHNREVFLSSLWDGWIPLIHVSSKGDMIEMFDHVDKVGANPFDLLYWRGYRRLMVLGQMTKELDTDGYLVQEKK